MQFSNVLGSFVFRVLISGQVLKITCPRNSYGDTASGRNGEIFNFKIENNPRNYEIFCTYEVLTAKGGDGIFPVIVIIAAKHCIVDQAKCILHYDSYALSSRDSLDGISDADARERIMDYISLRHQTDFKPPFTVLELVVALESSPSRMIRNLEYLHRTGKIAFGWGKVAWHTGPTDIEWLVYEFEVPSDTWDELEHRATRITRTTPTEGIAHKDKRWDFFICHASEDKHDVVEPLYQALTARGTKVWLDKFALTVGDRLLENINEGLLESRFGIVVLSPDFFLKEWPKLELEGLAQLAIGGRKVILPVWHKVDRDFIVKRTPILAGIVAAKTVDGVEKVADELLRTLV